MAVKKVNKNLKKAIIKLNELYETLANLEKNYHDIRISKKIYTYQNQYNILKQTDFSEFDEIYNTSSSKSETKEIQKILDKKLEEIEKQKIQVLSKIDNIVNLFNARKEDQLQVQTHIQKQETKIGDSLKSFDVANKKVDKHYKKLINQERKRIEDRKNELWQEEVEKINKIHNSYKEKDKRKPKILKLVK